MHQTIVRVWLNLENIVIQGNMSQIFCSGFSFYFMTKKR